MKQDERRQQTTQLLLETTKQLIREKGCDSLTMKDIMERSGLSKGAIFHYVKSKDEIYAWVLKERNERINLSFMGEVEHGAKELEGPLQKITDILYHLEDPQDVANKVLKYLLGKEDQPAVAEVLRQFYEQSVSFSKQWIVTGQQHPYMRLFHHLYVLDCWDYYWLPFVLRSCYWRCFLLTSVLLARG
jgi:AcrR family transcriptional regulator